MLKTLLWPLREIKQIEAKKKLKLGLEEQA